MNNDDCVFCQIINGSVSGEIIREDNDFVAFRDINPQAPEHILIIPRKHIERLSQTVEEDTLLLGKMLSLAAALAKENNFISNGYRIVINEGKDGGQTVYHIHLHLLAGRRLLWPPG
jgi:histidine triad (HIT) family protein